MIPINSKRQSPELKNLTWQNYREIAAELDRLHNIADVMALHRNTLIAMVENIPGFNLNGMKPDTYSLDDIRFEWFFLKKRSEDAAFHDIKKRITRNKTY